MNQTSSPSSSILGSLRIGPQDRDLTFDKALQIAERQAAKLLAYFAVDDGIHIHHIECLPRFVVAYEDIPVCGMTHWSGTDWIITLNKTDPPTRQRFTLLHEFKHIIDHGISSQLYRGDAHWTASEQAEFAADYFAGCALIPKGRLRAAWRQHIRRVPTLAQLFGVSESAIRVRLVQTGLCNFRDATSAVRRAQPVSTARSHVRRFNARRSADSRRYA